MKLLACAEASIQLFELTHYVVLSQVKGLRNNYMICDNA